MTRMAAGSRSTKVTWPAPRESASMPGRATPGEQVQDPRVLEVGLEDREQRLLDAVAERPRLATGSGEADRRGPAGDDPPGVSHRSSAASSPAVAGGHAREPAARQLAARARRRRHRGRRARRGASPRAPGVRGQLAVVLVAGATRRAAAAGRSGRGRGRRPRGAARSPSRRARSRRGARPTAFSRSWATSSAESETRTQNDSTVPRPTRPRSWWSWASPNRSAPSMTIIVASGTSTPTSTTVVPTSTSRSPSRKRAISASRSAAFIRPWTRPTRSGASSSSRRRTGLASRPRARRLASRPRRRLVVVDRAGHDDERPVARAASSRTRSHVPSSSSGPADPGPDRRRDRRAASAGPTRRGPRRAPGPSVRGIGVAVISRTCGAPPAGLRLERAALFDAEPVLLVDDDERQVREATTCPGSARASRRRPPPGPSAIASCALGVRDSAERARQQRDADPEVLEQRADGLDVLAGEQVGRGEERPLASRRAPRPRAHTPRPRSCPSRHRPGGAGASAWAGPGRRGCPPIALSLVGGQLDLVPDADRAGASVSAARIARVRRVVERDGRATRLGHVAAAGRPCPSWSASSSSNASRRSAASRPSNVSG